MRELLGFVLKDPKISRIMIGVDNLDQLKDIVKASKLIDFLHIQKILTVIV